MPTKTANRKYFLEKEKILTIGMRIKRLHAPQLLEPLSFILLNLTGLFLRCKQYLQGSIILDDKEIVLFASNSATQKWATHTPMIFFVVWPLLNGHSLMDMTIMLFVIVTNEKILRSKSWNCTSVWWNLSFKIFITYATFKKRFFG